MQVQRFSVLIFFILYGIVTIPQVSSIGFFGRGGEEHQSPIGGLLRKDSKLIGIFSRPPPEKEPKHEEEGGGDAEVKDPGDNPSFIGHLGNVLKGGTIGFKVEARPLGPIHDLIGHAKNIFPKPFVPGIHKPETVPEKQPPVKNPDEKPNPGKPETIETEKEWSHHDDKKPNVDGPKWEDIGEASTDYDYGSLDVIQPRKRPKRFIESKIYHVPLEFMSNAKPIHVRIKADDNFLNRMEPK